MDRRRPTTSFADARLRQALVARLTECQSLLGRHVAEARPILTTLLTERLIFTPHRGASGAWYEFRGVAALGRLLERIVLPKGVVAPTGDEALWKQEFGGLVRIA